MSKCDFIDTTGLRECKILDMAIFDWVALFLGAYLTTHLIHWFGYLTDISFLELYMVVSFILTFVGVATHIYLKIPTMFGYYLGVNTLEAAIQRRLDCTQI